MERLEALVSQMEIGEVGLEEMVSRFEEGSHLLNLCIDKLKAAEHRIEILKQDRRTLDFEKFQPEDT